MIYAFVHLLLSSSRQYLSCNACLEAKRENNQNCSMLCCVRQLCAMISTLANSSYSSMDWVFVTLGPFHCTKIICACLYVFHVLFYTVYVVLAYCEHGGVGLMGLKPSP